jgi:hypothetical protein
MVGRDVQASLHCAIGIVFVGLRIAEIGQYAVTQIFSHMTTEPVSHLRAMFLILGQDNPQVFWIEPR